MLASLAATTNSYPGSLIKGNPASDTSATSRPNSNCSMIKQSAYPCYVRDMTLMELEYHNDYTAY